MNPASDPVPQIVSIISEKNSGLICLPENPQQDTILAATALYQGLTKLGKNVSIVCATPIQNGGNGTDKIQSTMSTAGNNLVISLPYTDGSIDKVDYNIQGNYFNLIITPKEGFPKLNSNEVTYSYTGGVVDFIITIDTPSLKNLGSIYQNNQKQFEGKTIINIDRRLTNTFFGKVNYVSKTSSSTSEVVLKILIALKLEIDREMATGLYSGLAAATNNFTSYSVNAVTFETAAYLLKLGAVKRRAAGPAPVRNNYALPQQPVTPPMRQQPMPPTNNYIPSIDIEKQAVPSMDQVKPIEEVEQAPQPQDSNEAPEDWLKPKIFKGGSNLV